MVLEVREVSERRVAYLRAYGRYLDTFPKLWPRFSQLAMGLGLFSLGGARLSIMHDDMDSAQADKIRGDAAIEVPWDWQAQGGLEVQVVPGGLYALAEHQGPYDRLSQTWGDVIVGWLPSSGYRLRQPPSYEVYVSDPRTTPPQELMTVLYLPVEKV